MRLVCTMDAEQIACLRRASCASEAANHEPRPREQDEPERHLGDDGRDKGADRSQGYAGAVAKVDRCA